MLASDKEARVTGCRDQRESFVAAQTYRAQSAEELDHRLSVLLWYGAAGHNWWTGTVTTGLATQGMC